MYTGLRIYRLNDFDFSEQDLTEKLAEKPAQDPVGTEKSQSGWMSIFGKKSEEFVHSVMGLHMVSWVTTSRILPKAAVDCLLEDKISLIQESEDREPSPKEIKELRKVIEAEMTPKAFLKRSAINAIIDPKGKYLFVLTSSGKPADDLTAALRRSLGSLKAFPLETLQPAGTIMTGWFCDGDLPDAIEPGSKCTLVDSIPDSDEKPTEITFNNSDAASNDVARLLGEGMQIKKLRMVWDNRFSMVLSNDLSVSTIRPTDLLSGRISADMEEESARAHADTSLIIFGTAFRELADSMVSWFGGEADYAKLAEERHGIKNVPTSELPDEAVNSGSADKHEHAEGCSEMEDTNLSDSDQGLKATSNSD